MSGTVVSVFTRIGFIKENASQASLYEQLAEECTELAQAALKKARKLRGENYTPLSDKEIDKKVKEEVSDVDLCLMILGIDNDIYIVDEKLERWVNRINKSEQE